MAQHLCRCDACMGAREYEKQRVEGNRQYADLEQIRNALSAELARESRWPMTRSRQLWLRRVIADTNRVLTQVPGDAQTLEVQSYLAGEDVADLGRFVPVTMTVPTYVADFMRELQAEFPLFVDIKPTMEDIPTIAELQEELHTLIDRVYDIP